MPFELQVALRYLLAKRREGFISVISLVSTIGVTVGVMALVIALALMTGLQMELRDRILGANPHVFVWKPGGFVDARGGVGSRGCRWKCASGSAARIRTCSWGSREALSMHAPRSIDSGRCRTSPA